MAIYKLKNIANIKKGFIKYTPEYCLKNSGKYAVFSSKTMNDGLFCRINSFDFEKGRALITSRGANAGTVLYANEDFSMTANCYTFFKKQNNYLDKFLYYFLKKIEPSIKAQSQGSAIPAINNKEIYEIEVNIPSLETQKQLIDIIEPLEIINALFNEKKLFLFQKLNLIQKEIMNINSKFPAFKLESVANIIKGSSKYTSTYCLENIGEFPVYSSKTTGSIYFSKINSFDFEGNKVLITSDGIYAGTPLFSKENFSITSHCYVITKKTNNFLDKFLFYFFKNDENKIKKLAHGSTREALSKKNLGTFSINLPPLEIQQQIIEILEPLYQQLELVQKAKNLYEKKFNYFLVVGNLRWLIWELPNPTKLL